MQSDTTQDRPHLLWIPLVAQTSYYHPLQVNFEILTFMGCHVVQAMNIIILILSVNCYFCLMVHKRKHP